jgi:hypothetical protein
MARVDVPIVGAALCLIPVSRYNDSAPTRPVNGSGKPSGSATRWPPTLIIKPTSETRGRRGKPGIATTGASIAKGAPITVNAIGFCKPIATKPTASSRLQRWTRQEPYPL